MLKQLSYKVKFYLALFLILFVSILVYNKYLRHTINLFKENRELEEIFKKKQNDISKYEYLSKKSSEISKTYTHKFLPSNIVNQNILAFALKFQNVKTNKLFNVNYEENQGYKIYTYQIILQGDYNDLANIVYQFELLFKDAYLNAIKYYKVKNKLYVKLFFKTYEKV